ncbi:interferon-induced, double-stranded RNA-activated protein kinase [Folsomia candida]|nr:interferon-induced, double-stranded RNA-activated protein kinase [Folsomia candida]
MSNFLFLKLELCHFNLKTWIQAGRDVAESVAIDRVQKVGQSLDVMTQLSRGLDYVHGKGYIHRDLKPNNILGKICSDDQVVWKIGDFGLSVPFFAETASSWKNEGAGCDLYRSPEMITGLGYSEKTDIYSLGLIFLQLCSILWGGFDLALVVSELRKLTSDTGHDLILANLCGAKDPLFRDILNTMLSLRHTRRPTARELLVEFIHAEDHYFKENERDDVFLIQDF